ncbi:MAG TPA: ABC transporter permease [Patescibacteria group bacterium]|nr:ABC transporter permease [Patescibacteria group bacterium]
MAAIPITYNLRSLMVRRTTSMMTALGIGLVVMVVVILLSFVSGLRRSFELVGEPGHWIILSRGTYSEGESYIPRAQSDILRSRPEIATDQSGAALFSPEMVVPFNAAVNRPATQFRPASLRGVSPIAYRMRRGLQLVAGRWPAQGRDEMAIGRKQAARFPELGVGTTFKYGRRTWTIVGIFADRGSALESEFWTDIDVLQQDARFENGYSSFHAVLKPGTEETFKNALNEDARLTVDAMSEREFLAARAKVADRLRELVLMVGLIVGTGAAFGGMNTMYAAVARRTREVGVLRTLGFGSGSVLTCFLMESVILALAGGIAGEALALILGFAADLNGRLMTVDGVVFSSAFTVRALVIGIVAAVLIGIAGGLMPAWRAAHLPIVESLREA